MRSALQPLLLAAAAVGALCAASTAAAQSYGGQGYSAPPPPPPPLPGQAFERDDRYVEGSTFQNSDATYGYRNHTSRPDATPDDPNGYAYQAQRDRRFGGYGPGQDDDAYGPPPPRYTARPYGSQGDGDGYAPGYRDERRGPPSAYADRYDDEDAPPPPPRYVQPGYGYGGGYPAYGPNRGW